MSVVDSSMESRWQFRFRSVGHGSGTVSLASGLVVLTWFLMVWGALTRAARAGVACPDWPLCHGRWIPPVDAGFYPPDPNYAVYRVYLEFIHRVLAGLVTVGTVFLSVRLWRKACRGLVALMGSILVLQVSMGAVTVWLRNAPFTVVIHLGLALGFLGTLLQARRRLAGTGDAGGSVSALTVGYRVLLVLVFVQMLVGAVVSSRSIGLACYDFPLCNGLPLPPVWNGPVAWQFTHRVLGWLTLVGAWVLHGAAVAMGLPRSERRWTLGLSLGLFLQVLLGGVNVWLRIPPLASAAHLGLAVVLFALLVEKSSGVSPASERLSCSAVGERG